MRSFQSSLSLHLPLLEPPEVRSWGETRLDSESQSAKCTSQDQDLSLAHPKTSVPFTRMTILDSHVPAKRAGSRANLHDLVKKVLNFLIEDTRKAIMTQGRNKIQQSPKTTQKSYLI